MKRSLMASLRTLLVAACPLAGATTASAYTHPGIPLTVSDVDAVKAKFTAGEQPCLAAYDALIADWTSDIRQFV